MGSGPSHSSSESHISENGSQQNVPVGQSSGGSKHGHRHRVNSHSRQRTQGTENSKKDELTANSSSQKQQDQKQQAKQGTTSSKKGSPNVNSKNRSEISHHGDDEQKPGGGDASSGQLAVADNPSESLSPRQKRQATLSSGLSLTAFAGAGNHSSSEVLVKMGSSMLRTKNCSEEFQLLDLGEPVVMGKFDHDKSRPLHPLALERYCVVESSSVSGFSSVLSSTQASVSDKPAAVPIAQRRSEDNCLCRLSEELPLYWLHVAGAADMRNAAGQLKDAGFESISVFICAADPVIFAKISENRKSSNPQDPAQTQVKKNVFFCLPALVRAAPPSRSLIVPGRIALAQLERDIKMSIVHLVAQDVASGGTFPAYFGATTTASQDAMSIGWTLGKITAAFADDINTASGAAAEEFELLRSRIHRIQTINSASVNEGACIDESEINTISKALMLHYYETSSQASLDNVFEQSPLADESNNPCKPKSAIVAVTFEELSSDSGFVLLLAAIAITLQQQTIPMEYRKFFEKVPPLDLSGILKGFATHTTPLAGYFDEFITQIGTTLFRGNNAPCAHFLSGNRSNAIRYAYTFLFSYYCYHTYVCKSMTLTFSKWLRRHYLCYRSLAALLSPISEILEIAQVQPTTYLIAENDGVPMMSVVSSDFGVRAHGFRKIPPAPVYGSQSPTTDELAAIVDYCSVVGKRWRHTVVVWCDLRPNPVIYVDGKPYLIANGSGRSVAENKIVNSGADIEQVEDYFKANLFNVVNPNFIKRSAGVVVPVERKEPPKMVMTPRELANNLHLMPRTPSQDATSPKADVHQPHVVYFRLPSYDEKAPSEQVLQELVSIVLSQQSIYVDEDGPAFLFTCASGVGAVTAMMIAATLITYHLNGFPFGCHVGEEERVSLKNVQYTQGNFLAVRELIEQLPRGNQVKREVDAVLDACWDRMTSTFYHLREIIFATFSKVFTIHEEQQAGTGNQNQTQTVESVYRQSIDYLERYVLLIIFNAYLHAKKHETGGWQNNTFQDWLSELAASDSPLIGTLDNLCFQEFGDEHLAVKCRHIRSRWLSGSSVKKVSDV